jgi:hypothetical protein
MTHPDRNDGNAIPVKMELVDGCRFYIPLDPTDETEFEWDRRDEEWEIVQGPDDVLAFESRAELAEQALVAAVEERDHLRVVLLDACRTRKKDIAAIMHNVRELRAQTAMHTGESTGNLDVLERRIEDGLRELIGLHAVQPELLSDEETPATGAVAYVLEWGAISLPLGHPSRITGMEVHGTFSDAAAAADACEFNARVFPITVPCPSTDPGGSCRPLP